MSIKVSYDLSPMERKFAPGNIKNARTMVANQVLLDSENYVPSDGEDVLRGTGKANNGSVSWNTVYARAQFFGTNGIVTFRKYTTSGTGSKWTEKASNSNMKNWEEVAKKGLGIR